MESLKLSAEDLKRETFLEIKQEFLYYLYKKHLQSFWVVEEINFENDKKDFQSLPKEEQDFMRKICTFFLISDAVVGDAVGNFSEEVPDREAKAFYSVQSMIENTHIETYSKMFDIVTDSSANKDFIEECLNAINSFPSVLKKRQFCTRKYETVPQQIAAFAFIEGVFFSASFSGIFWFKNRGKCKGIVQANSWILRDENLHCRFGCEVLKTYFRDKITTSEIIEIAKEVFAIESQFVTDLLPKDIGVMTIRDLETYVKHCINNILGFLTIKPLFPEVTKSPFDFMDYIHFSEKTNFFERRVNNYNLKATPTRFSYGT